MILVVNAVCNSKIALNFSTLNESQEVGQERMPQGGFWRPDVACNNNVTLALLVTSLTL